MSITRATGPTPEPTSTGIIFEKCEPRCYSVDEDKTKPLTYEVSGLYVKGKKEDKDGGSAVYLKDCGLRIVESSSTNCQAPNINSGAIYINSTAIRRLTISKFDFFNVDNAVKFNVIVLFT